MSCVLVNDFRVTFLQNGIIRIEKAVKGEFLDGNTFFVPARPAEVECARTEQGFEYNGYTVIIPDNLKKLGYIKINRIGKTF